MKMDQVLESLKTEPHLLLTNAYPGFSLFQPFDQVCKTSTTLRKAKGKKLNVSVRL